VIAASETFNSFAYILAAGFYTITQLQALNLSLKKMLLNLLGAFLKQTIL
jgi:hypothetical protein